MAKHIDHISPSAYLEIIQLCSPSPDEEGHCSAVVFLCSQSFGILQLFTVDITSDQIYRLQKTSESCSQSRFSQKQRWACYTTSQKAPLAPFQRKDTFQDSHLCLSFLWWYPATISVVLSLCVHSISYSVPVPMKKTLSCAKWKLKGYGHRSFPTSDTVAPSHSSKLLLRPSSALLPSPSYLDSLEDLRSPLPPR